MQRLLQQRKVAVFEGEALRSGAVAMQSFFESINFSIVTLQYTHKDTHTFLSQAKTTEHHSNQHSPLEQHVNHNINNSKHPRILKSYDYKTTMASNPFNSSSSEGSGAKQPKMDVHRQMMENKLRGEEGCVPTLPILSPLNTDLAQQIHQRLRLTLGRHHEPCEPKALGLQAKTNEQIVSVSPASATPVLPAC